LILVKRTDLPRRLDHTDRPLSPGYLQVFRASWTRRPRAPGQCNRFRRSDEWKIPASNRWAFDICQTVERLCRL